MATTQIPQIPDDLLDDMKANPPKGLVSLERARQLELGGIYENLENKFVKKEGLPWLFCVIGPSGAGKDTIVRAAIEKGVLFEANTSTTRGRRPDEAEDAYIWIKAEKGEEERLEDFVSRVKSEEGIELIEYDEHHGHIYGLPRKSLDEAAAKGPVLVRTDNAGAKTFKETLGESYNVVSVFILPEDFEQIWERIQGRGNEHIRFKESIEYVQTASEVTNFYLLNKEYRDPKIGIENSQEAFLGLIAELVKGSAK